MGKLRHREREVPLRRRRGPVGVDELRESGPGEPSASPVPLSVRQTELVGYDAVARCRPGRHRRGRPRPPRARPSPTPAPPPTGNAAPAPPYGPAHGPPLPPPPRIPPPPPPP